MHLVFKDPIFDAQWLRAAGHSAVAAEIGECFAAAHQIREGDLDSWFLAWSTLGDRLLIEADQSRGAARLESARAGFLRASNYLRAAYTFLIGTPQDERLKSTYRRQREAFEAATALMLPTAEPISIPYADTRLHGYLFRAPPVRIPLAANTAATTTRTSLAMRQLPNPRRPTLIITGGYDSNAEELYYFSGAAAVARGYTCIVFDGPGQGEAIIEQGLLLRPDWEAVIGPVVDYALTRPEVDPARIALMGISLGGHLAARAASSEVRLAACIADPGDFSLLQELQSRVPAFIARELPNGKAWVLTLFRRLLEERLHHPTRGWGLRRGLWVHGLPDVMSYVRATSQYTLEDCAGRIRCPTLICKAESDDMGATAGKLYSALTCEKRMMSFGAREGAGAHCEAGARALFNARVFDWLDGVLER